MAQKYSHGQMGGMRCPTPCHIIGKAKPPDSLGGQARRGEEAPLPPGLPPSCASTLTLVAVKGPSRKTTGELAL